jgi:hypothetical protein
VIERHPTKHGEKSESQAMTIQKTESNNCGAHQVRHEHRDPTDYPHVKFALKIPKVQEILREKDGNFTEKNSNARAMLFQKR